MYPDSDFRYLQTGSKLVNLSPISFRNFSIYAALSVSILLVSNIFLIILKFYSISDRKIALVIFQKFLDISPIVFTFSRSLFFTFKSFKNSFLILESFLRPEGRLLCDNASYQQNVRKLTFISTTFIILNSIAISLFLKARV